MDINEFNKKVKINTQNLYRLFAREVGHQINGLSEPCHEVRTKTFEQQLYRELGVTPQLVRSFAKDTFKDHPRAVHSQVVHEPFTFILMYLYHKFAEANMKKIAETVLLYSLIKHHASAWRKSFPKFCQPEVFQYTLNNIVKVHLYRVHRTIANALIYLASELQKQYYDKMKQWNPDAIYYLTTYSRKRTTQSENSFAQSYYKNSEEGKGIRKQQEPTDDENKNMFQVTTADTGKQAAVEKFIKNMFVYKNYDNKALEEAKRKSRVKTNLAQSIITQIHNRSSEENIKIILISLLKAILDTKSLCQDVEKIVKKLMMIRNYKDSFVFKNLVIGFADSIYETANPPSRHITERDKISLRLFVALYLAFSFRNLFCQSS